MPHKKYDECTFENDIALLMFEPVTFQPNIQPVLLPCAKATKARRSGSDMSLKTKNSQKKTIFKLSRNSKTASVKRKQPKKVKKQARIKANSAGSESKSRTKPKQMRRATRRAKGRMVGLANRRSGRHTRYKKTLSPHHTCTPARATCCPASWRSRGW